MLAPPRNWTELQSHKWVFTYKLDTNSDLQKFKAWLCVRGDLQPPTVFDLKIWHPDAINAFINSTLDEIVHCAYPPGFEIQGQCLLLLRALYGLRRSLLLWLRELSQALNDLGLKETQEGSCLFTDGYLIAFFYVNNIVLLCRKENIPKLCSLRGQLLQRYEMRDLGPVILLDWTGLDLGIGSSPVQSKDSGAPGAPMQIQFSK